MNMKKSFDEADELDGFETLNEPDQEKIRKAWTDGHVADEDIPETARKAEGDDDEEEEEEVEKPKKGAKGKAVKKEDKSSVFKFEYASTGRSKCKGASNVVPMRK